MTFLIPILSSGDIFKILVQFKKGSMIKNSTRISIIKHVSTTYVVLTYILANLNFPEEKAFTKLFRSPYPNPISNKVSQAIIELIVSQIPYCSFPTKEIERGTNKKLTSILTPLKRRENKACFFSVEKLPLPK